LVTGGEYKTIVKDVRLGTTNNRIATIREYSFILERATETEIDLVVKKSIEAHTPEVGYISGKVTLGPICPVEQAGVPCVIPAETYTSRKVIVFATDQQTVVKTTALDAGGWYKLTLDPGTYWLQVEPAGIGPGEMKKVTVTQLQTSVIDFDIDTGIR
jgi:hypothetical protein